MAIQVKVPALGESVKQAMLLKWHKHDGDAVKIDEPICELESDKANVDIPAECGRHLPSEKTRGRYGRCRRSRSRRSIRTGVHGKVRKVRRRAENRRARRSSQRRCKLGRRVRNGRLRISAPPCDDCSRKTSSIPNPSPRTGPAGRLTKEDVESISPPAIGPLPASQPPLIPPPTSRERKKDVATVAPPQPAPPRQAIMFDSTGIHRAAA